MEEKRTCNEAWQYLDEALFTSKHVKAKDIKEGSTDWDNVYPTSLEEVDKMDTLIDMAEKAAGNERDEEFNERVEDLREITEWSRQRHKTWKWSLIAGAILSAAIFYFFNSSNKDDIKKSEEVVALVENWTEADTTLTYKQVEGNNGSNDYYSVRLRNAKWYKVYLLNKAKSDELSMTRYAAEYAQKADTASTKERKEKYMKSSEESAGKAKEYRTEFDKVAGMKYAEIKNLALEDVKGKLERDKSNGATTTGWLIYLIVLIPLYIFTGYSYGYTITCHRRQHSIMNWLQKWGFRIAAFFFGTGVLMNLLPDDIVRYRYSDGSTRDERQTNAGNILIVVLKVGLIIIGILLFCFISVFIMTVQTITGLIRNFNWGALYNKVKGQKA